MNKHLKWFNTANQYKTYLESGDAYMPNVSVCNDIEKIQYNLFDHKSTPHLTATVKLIEEEDSYTYGDTLTPIILLQNDGTLTYNNITITCQKTNSQFTIDSLEPSKSKGFTIQYTVGSDDVREGNITFQIQSRGTDSQNNQATYNDTIVIPVNVVRREIQITTGSAEKVYDATPLLENSYQITRGSLVNGDTITVNVNGTQTLVGTNDNEAFATIKNSSNVDVTTNYNITWVYGTLEITDGTGSGEEPVEDDLVITCQCSNEPENGGFLLSETVDYDVYITNIYDTRQDITLSTIEGVTLAQSQFENVAAGETVQTTATYVITEQDILNYGFEATFTAEVGNITKRSDWEVSVEEPNGHLSVNKETTSTPANSEMYALGETITYEITVTNDGNLTITDIDVTDELTNDEWTIESLAPGESEEFVPAPYAVTEYDTINGWVLNDATASGTSPDPEKPDVPVDPGHTDDVTVDYGPILTIGLREISRPIDGIAYGSDEAIVYQVKINNDGSVPISNIKLNVTCVGGRPNRALIIYSPTLQSGQRRNETLYVFATQVGQVTTTVTFASADNTSEDPTTCNGPVRDTAQAKAAHSSTVVPIDDYDVPLL